jgi:hypothetical protein
VRGSENRLEILHVSGRESPSASFPFSAQRSKLLSYRLQSG